MTDTTVPAPKRENPFQLLGTLGRLSEKEQRLLAHVQGGKADPDIRDGLIRVCWLMLGFPHQQPTPQPDRPPPIEAGDAASESPVTNW